MLRKLNTKRGGFTLVEIMIVVAIIALLAAIAVPNFLRSRKRSQATQLLEDLRVIASAVDQYAIENNKKRDDSAAWTDVQKYLKTDTRLYACNYLDLFGNTFSGAPVGTTAYVAGTFYVDGNVELHLQTFNALSDVAPASFWSPYYNP